MVDEGRATRLLRAITDRLDRLDAARARQLDARDDLWLDGIKYLLVTTIETCVDVAQHIGSSERWRSPDSNADAVRLLGEHHVVDTDVADRLARAVGFRNVLVHQYVTVDDTKVLDALDRLDDVATFVAQVAAWIDRQRDRTC
jgi:uncharacterized protein YutE (UPF0331/DUF86 family)